MKFKLNQTRNKVFIVITFILCLVGCKEREIGFSVFENYPNNPIKNIFYLGDTINIINNIKYNKVAFNTPEGYRHGDTIIPYHKIIGLLSAKNNVVFCKNGNQEYVLFDFNQIGLKKRISYHNLSNRRIEHIVNYNLLCDTIFFSKKYDDTIHVIRFEGLLHEQGAHRYGFDEMYWLVGRKTGPILFANSYYDDRKYKSVLIDYHGDTSLIGNTKDSLFVYRKHREFL